MALRHMTELNASAARAFEDHIRAVRFSAPGRYVLKATSSTWCSAKVDSNTLVVVVRP